MPHNIADQPPTTLPESTSYPYEIVQQKDLRPGMRGTAEEFNEPRYFRRIVLPRNTTNAH
ncbi:MAG TPA: hypothetical protein VEW05_31055 [Candidatus Polarisedimenticolia bacterium]|nr:hypothetical protein [Candidatus Polarisedimenticolia bacterium]